MGKSCGRDGTRSAIYCPKLDQRTRRLVGALLLCTAFGEILRAMAQARELDKRSCGAFRRSASGAVRLFDRRLASEGSPLIIKITHYL